MRKSLLAAVALAPLWFLASQTPAAAQTTITNSTSAPQTTAADGDITINSGGSISPNLANTAAITINSSNNVVNGGTIADKDVNSVVGIEVLGGNGSAGSTLVVTNSGTIALNESYASTDSNKDGVNEAPFASPTSTGRYGIQLMGTQPFYGNIANTASIVIQGDQSYGISLEGPLAGSLTNTGTITLTGDNGAALRETAGVNVIPGVAGTGNVLISGAITVLGQNSNAVSLSGAVGGRVSVYSTLSSTDYGTVTRSTTPSELSTVQGTANTSINEVNPNAGSAMVVSANVGAGIIIGAQPANTNTSDVTTDLDGDGIVDSGETSGSVITYGSAPGLVIGGANNITIGPFASTPVIPTGGIGTNSGGYGLVIEGSVDGLGIYDNVSSTGLQIGGLGGTTTIAGGIQILGAVDAASYGAASAVGIHIGAGATVPTIFNGGTIGASIDAPNTTTNTIPPFNATATAIQIDAASGNLAGGQVTSLINNGTIAASITASPGGVDSVTAVVDRGGGITSVINTGAITTALASDTLNTTVSGTGVTLANGNTTQNTSGTIALDLSANTTGTTLTQQQAPTLVVTTTTTDSVTTSVVTNVAPVSGTLVQTTAADTTTTTSGSTIVTSTVPASPEIVGDIYLGNGSNTVNILAGTVTGALSMGSGATGSVTIDNGAIYTGAFTYTGAALALNVNNGTFDNSSPSASPTGLSNVPYKLSSLNVGSTGILYFGVDPVNNRAAEFLVSGAATIASGAQIGLTFISNATGPQTFTILKAGSLNLGSSTAISGPVPYIFNASLTPNVAAGTITLAVSPKSATQLGLNPSQSAALPATYQALTGDSQLQTAFLNQYSRSGFLSVYNQILPDYAGGTFQAANAASLAISRATAESNDIENPTGSRGAWAEEIFVGVNQGSGQTDGFRGGGVGFVGGLETGGSGLGAFGVTSAFVTTSVTDPHLPGDSQTALSEFELGGYWQGDFNGLTTDARLGAGYASVAGRREFVQTDATTGDITLDRKEKAQWGAYTISGRFGASYRWSFNDHFLGGGWFLQPQAHVDYFMLAQGSHNDNAAQSDSTAFAYAYQGTTGQETSGTASITLGRKLGTGLVWRPQVELGVRDVFTGTAGDTTVRFEGTTGAPTGSSFTLTPADVTGTAGIARFKLKASSEYYELGVEAGGEVLSSRYQEGDVKASIRVLF
jgi:hypothetical protein